MEALEVGVELCRLEDLLPLEQNARFMRHETFQQLVANLKRDGRLTSTPFVWLNEERGGLEILSGNHRVAAAIEAGIEEAWCLVCREYLSEDRRIAIQLSHNAIEGEDDASVLKSLYQAIGDVDLRLYAGLDDETLHLLESVQPASLSEARLDFATVSLVFLPDELEEAQRVWGTVRSLIGNVDDAWLARWSEYDDWLDTIETAGSSHGISNTATAVAIVLELVRRNLPQLSEGFMSDQAQQRNPYVPIAAVLGTDKIPAQVAKRLHAAVERAIQQGSVPADERWKILDGLDG